eukprot:TRINITY_DN65050_c0_g1_i2.p1 TRINITY_DN65050_c0_g1~~TRINITY_DN65050_c0_g1_i2.p1  ORF type:complete len:136 (+),score=50.45 TRINITY_DN65050_c0_g1_i2:70-477(+)
MSRDYSGIAVAKALREARQQEEREDGAGEEVDFSLLWNKAPALPSKRAAAQQPKLKMPPESLGPASGKQRMSKAERKKARKSAKPSAKPEPTAAERAPDSVTVAKSEAAGVAKKKLKKRPLTDAPTKPMKKAKKR